MSRIHLFEFHDLELFPSSMRHTITDFLHTFAVWFKPYECVAPKLKESLEKAGTRRVIDLCSGSGGPLQGLAKELARRDFSIEVTLTDKFPNLEAFQRASQNSGGAIRFVESSVDATVVPATLHGFRTLFTSFHHFRPAQARAILADAAHKREGIAVFEMTERSLFMIVATILSPLLALLMMPFVRPFRWMNLFWTYLVPIFLLVGVWEGVISNLRTYSPAELRELTARINEPSYVWETGKLFSRGFRITYLIGLPTDN